MSDAVLQILLVLIYLSIGLVSVTFPIYAICVAFLPKQKWEDEKERKKRIDELKAKISQLTNELKGESQDVSRVTELKAEIDKYKNELESTELRYQYLTAKGAVGIPVISLVLALFFASLGINAFYDNADVVLPTIGAIVCSAFSIYRLYMTISAVEYGALRPERTVQFKVDFGEEGEKTLRVQLNEKIRPMCFFTPEADIENLFVLAKFPSELGVTKKNNPAGNPNLYLSEFKRYSLMCYTLDFVPKDSAVGFSFTGFPEEKGEYPVTVRIRAKGIYEYNEELTIEVI
jgi:hypothetical protein